MVKLQFLNVYQNSACDDSGLVIGARCAVIREVLSIPTTTPSRSTAIRRAQHEAAIESMRAVIQLR